MLATVMEPMMVKETSARTAPGLTVEQQQLRAAQRGEISAFNQLARTHQRRLYRIAFRILGNEDAAADATQEALISAYRHLKQFRGGSFQGWLTRILTNACYDQLRLKQRHPTTPLDTLLDAPGDAAVKLEQRGPESPQEAAERHELDGIIQQGLLSLPAEQRVTLVLADIEEYAYQQVAEMTGTNIGTVKSRLARARAALRDYLLAQEDGLPRAYRRGN